MKSDRKLHTQSTPQAHVVTIILPILLAAVAFAVLSKAFAGVPQTNRSAASASGAPLAAQPASVLKGACEDSGFATDVGEVAPMSDGVHVEVSTTEPKVLFARLAQVDAAPADNIIWPLDAGLNVDVFPMPPGDMFITCGDTPFQAEDPLLPKPTRVLVSDNGMWVRGGLDCPTIVSTQPIVSASIAEWAAMDDETLAGIARRGVKSVEPGDSIIEAGYQDDPRVETLLVVRDKLAIGRIAWHKPPPGVSDDATRANEAVLVRLDVEMCAATQ